MKFTVNRDTFLQPLQAVIGVVERRQTLPILGNVLLSVADDMLSVTATDMEVELVARTRLDGAEPGDITVPARKLVDICRSLPSEATIEFALSGEKVTVRSGRSRFTLSTLPAKDFPSTDRLSDDFTMTLVPSELKRVIELTHFAMAHQDVRYYLNGLLLEIGGKKLRAVATDGHRLAVADLAIEEAGDDTKPIIVPRKGVSELLRLLGSDEEQLTFVIGTNAVQVTLGDIRFTSKLIDGRFPDYTRVIPDPEQCDKRLVLDRDTLRQSLSRASILSNDKYRAIRLSLAPGVLRVIANNPEQEEAEDELELDYQGETLDVGFNVSYLIDALGALPTATARLFLTDSDSSCLIQPDGANDCQFVVMPMRL